MTTPLSAEVVRAVESVLAEEGVRHGPLREGPAWLNRNLSDGQNVFVKVSEPVQGESIPEPAGSRAAAEIRGALWAAEHGVRTVSPLVSDVRTVEVDQDGPRDVTVWGFHQEVSPPSMVDQILGLMNSIDAVSEVPSRDGCSVFDVRFFEARVMSRLDGCVDDAANMIREKTAATAAEVAERTSDEPYQWIHGDLHVRNLMWTVSGLPAIVDWESNTVGPLSWELAQVTGSVLNHFPRHCTRDKQRFLGRVENTIAEKFPHVNIDTVQACTDMRTLSWLSHVKTTAPGTPLEKFLLERAATI